MKKSNNPDSMVIDVIKSDKGYLFTLPSLGYVSSRYYKINGEKVDASKTYTTETEPVIEYYTIANVKVKAKSLLDSQPDLTIEEYEKKKEDMESKRIWDSYEEHKIFENLDDEYEYKKFVRDYQIITRTDEEFIQSFQLNIKEKLESDNPYIVLHRHIGKEIASQAATYNRWGFYKCYVRKLLNDKGFKETDSTSSIKGIYKIYQYNDGMVNLYVEGKQLFDIKVWSFSDELDIVEKKYQEDKQWIEDKINSYLKNSRNLPSVQDVISKLNSILKQVQKIDCKVKSIDEYNISVRWIKDFINELEKGNYSK
jgi:hypothetical protein